MRKIARPMGRRVVAVAAGTTKSVAVTLQLSSLEERANAVEGPNFASPCDNEQQSSLAALATTNKKAFWALPDQYCGTDCRERGE